jgi:hypothetical protein
MTVPASRRGPPMCAEIAPARLRGPPCARAGGTGYSLLGRNRANASARATLGLGLPERLGLKSVSATRGGAELYGTIFGTISALSFHLGHRHPHQRPNLSRAAARGQRRAGRLQAFSKVLPDRSQPP